jgi:signal transduction histidine kinase
VDRKSNSNSGVHVRDGRSERASEIPDDLARVLAELAAAFISVPATQLGPQIEKGVGLIGRFLGADRCAVYRYRDDPEERPIVYEWCADGVAPFKSLLEATPLRHYAWSLGRLRNGEILEFSGLSAIPEEARSEREVFVAADLKSLLLVPLSLGNEVLGSISCGSVSRSGLWANVDHGVLVSIAEMFANALERLRAECERTDRLEFEQMTVRLAAHFISLAPDQIEDGVRRAIAELGRYTGAVRIGVFVLPKPDADYARLLCEWMPDTAPGPVGGEIRVPTPAGGWIRNQVLTRGVHRADRTADMPDEIGDVRDLMLQLKIASGLSFPLVSVRGVFGWLGVSAETSPVPWSEDSHSLFKIFAEIIGNALERLRMQKEIQFRTEFQALLTDFATGFINLPVAEIDDGIVRALERLAAFMDTDRAGIFLFERGGESARLAYEWRAPDTPDAKELLGNIPMGPGSWADEWLMQLRVDELRSVDDIPAEHAVVREILERCGIHSAVYVPLESQERQYGWLSLANSEAWRLPPKEHMGPLKIAAEMFSNAMGRVRREEELEAQRQALAHVHRVGTMNELAAGIAHELHQPLTAVANYASSIKHLSVRSPVDAMRIKELAHETVEQAIRAGDVVHGMRAQTTGELPLRQPYAAHDLVRDALALMTHDLRQLNVVTAFEVPEDLPPVVVRPVHIQQVVVNLLRNAADALALVEDADRRLNIEGRLLPSGEGAVVEISIGDNGPGFPQEQAATLFDQFVSSKQDGLGLGLSISRSLIEAHGGGLSAESDGVNGAVFRFTLPVANESTG